MSVPLPQNGVESGNKMLNYFFGGNKTSPDDACELRREKKVIVRKRFISIIIQRKER